jgi:hypothetical protein
MADNRNGACTCIVIPLLGLGVAFLVAFYVGTHRFEKEYPKSNNEAIHALFSRSRHQIVTPKNQIVNLEMEREVSRVIDDALKFEGIYLFYGENGIGKSIALQKMLRNRTSIHYVYVENGMKGLPKLLTPDYNKDSKVDVYETIKEALLHYSDYRKAQNLNGMI